METKRGRAVRSSLAPEDGRQPELTRNLYSAHRWASIVKRPAQRTATPVLLIPRAKPQGSMICAKSTRLGNPILHTIEPVGKTLAQLQTKDTYLQHVRRFIRWLKDEPMEWDQTSE